MARKPNYQFDRFERDRQKATKKAERLAAKQAKSADRKDGDSAPDESAAPLTEDAGLPPTDTPTD
jgi:hypothetical protein